MTYLKVVSNNFIIFGANFMKVLPNCNTKSDIGKFIIKFWNFLALVFKKKQGPISSPDVAKENP